MDVNDFIYEMSIYNLKLLYIPVPRLSGDSQTCIPTGKIKVS